MESQPEIESVEDIDRILNGDDKPQPLMNLSKMPVGDVVAGVLEGIGVEMTPEERKQIEGVSDDEAMQAFFDANLGNEPFIGELKARSLFGSYMMRKMNHRAIGFATRYMNIRSTQMCIEFAMKLATKEGATDEDKVNAGKLWLLANRELSVMLKRYDDIAQQLAPDGKKPKGKNKAPDIFISDSNVVVAPQPSGAAG